MAVDILLDKINKFVETKKTEHDNKVNSEKSLCEEYKEKIKALSQRVADLIEVGNTMRKASYIVKQTPSYTEYSNVLADFHKSIAEDNITMKFMNGVKRESRRDTDEDKELKKTIVGIGFINKNSFNQDVCFYVYPNGDVERLTEFGSGGYLYFAEDSSHPITSKILCRFLTEFDKFEKAVMDFVENLEV